MHARHLHLGVHGQCDTNQARLVKPEVMRLYRSQVFIHMAPVDPFMHVPGDPEEDEQEESAEER